MGFGTTEIILIVAVIVLFFGASKIPDLARGVGEGISEFRKASEKELEDDKNEKKDKSDSDNRHSESREVKQPKNS